MFCIWNVKQRKVESDYIYLDCLHKTEFVFLYDSVRISDSKVCNYRHYSPAIHY